MIHNVVLHVVNELPLMADLYGLPSASDAGLLCTNLRMLDGKRPIFIDHTESTFFFPYHVIRFLELPAGAADGLASDQDPGSHLGQAPEEPIDAEPESLLPIPLLSGPSEPADGEIDIEIDEDFLQRIRDI